MAAATRRQRAGRELRELCAGGNKPIASEGRFAPHAGAEVVLARALDEFPEGTLATIVEADAASDEFQLRIEGADEAAWVEARREDFTVLIHRLPRPFGIGDGIAYTSDRTLLMRRYGLSEEQYERLLNTQHGCCAICHAHAELLGAPLRVDHDEETGKVRGLLCDSHNLGLGKFDHSVDLLKSAIDYLRSPPAAALGIRVPSK